ncbi:MAG: glycosyltransferase family 39 protein [Candidatus Aenigmarchaeota archaeon]|nr:glycosyltransferase family 39 protein [Candidatus Aenigmarchaeota archaeon]
MNLDDILIRLGLKEESKAKSAMNFVIKNWWVWCLIAITVFSFWTRMIPAKYGELQALDPFYAYRINELMLQNNLQVPEFDPIRYWPDGVPIEKYGPLMYFYVPVMLYVAMGSVGITMTYLNFAIMYPALMGALSVLIMFFLAREIFDDKNAGLFSAFFLATVPGYIARTSAGFFDKEATGGTFLLLAILLFVLAYKRNSWKYGALSAIAVFVSMGSWGGAQFIIYIVSIFAVVMLLLNKFSRNMIPSVIFVLLSAVATQRLFLGLDLTIEQIIAIVTILMILIRYAAERYEIIKKEQFIYIAPVIIVSIILFMLVGSMFSDTLWYMVNRAIGLVVISEQGVIASTVAEQMPGSWSDITSRTDIGFGLNILPALAPYSMLLSVWFLMMLGIIFAAYTVYTEKNMLIMIPVFWLLMSVQTVLYMVRLVFFLGPPAAIMAGYCVAQLIKLLMKYNFTASVKGKDIKLLAIPLVIFVSLVILSNAVTGYVFCNSLGPSYNQYWDESMTFMKENTAANASILSWWDFGYWFQTRGERPSIADGGNINGTVNHQIAEWYIDRSDNWTSYRSWLKSKQVDYILMDYTLPGKYGAISKIGTHGKTIIGMLQMQYTGEYPQENKTIAEFKSGQYVVWLPMGSGGNVVGAPLFMVTNGEQYLGRSYIQDMCTTNGIIRIPVEDESSIIPGCVTITSYGLFYIPPEAEFSTFTNLMFMDGYGIPDVEKVFDNQLIKIYRLEINESI